jgi:hypothetical protein
VPSLAEPQAGVLLGSGGLSLFSSNRRAVAAPVPLGVAVISSAEWKVPQAEVRPDAFAIGFAFVPWHGTLGA